MMKKLLLYGRPDCHLCQDMEAELRRLQPEAGFRLEVYDVDRDPAWAERYGRWVPVLEAEGREICHYFLDLVALQRYLQGP
ncbi:glutaredoxin family protein [Thiohalobacter sp. IOR34]|uniref:glutaredoxin family protein n=1 Tax=Thiohalobacter sp. IOR34 TaxID=3057176 RepID=UPI0025B0AFC8|nr:glutaredoxin family protein [Thiohalobacter sp. IOR34]WJW76137.1 glutaredoxin family protein [Thiohalobacter sp. IOR34]